MTKPDHPNIYCITFVELYRNNNSLLFIFYKFTINLLTCILIFLYRIPQHYCNILIYFEWIEIQGLDLHGTNYNTFMVLWGMKIYTSDSRKQNLA